MISNIGLNSTKYCVKLKDFSSRMAVILWRMFFFFVFSKYLFPEHNMRIKTNKSTSSMDTTHNKTSGSTHIHFAIILYEKWKKRSVWKDKRGKLKSNLLLIFTCASMYRLRV